MFLLDSKFLRKSMLQRAWVEWSKYHHNCQAEKTRKILEEAHAESTRSHRGRVVEQYRARQLKTLGRTVFTAYADVVKQELAEKKRLEEL